MNLKGVKIIKADNMKCYAIEHKLIFYLDYNLGKEETAKIKAHLDVCPVCSNNLQNLRDVLSVVDKEKITGEDPFFYTRVLHKMEKRSENGLLDRRSKYIIPAFQSLLVAASIAIGIFIGIKNADERYARNDYLDTFADQYYLFETDYDPFNEIVYKENGD